MATNSAGQTLNDQGVPEPASSLANDPAAAEGADLAYRQHREMVANEDDYPIIESGSGATGGVI